MDSPLCPFSPSSRPINKHHCRVETCSMCCALHLRSKPLDMHAVHTRYITELLTPPPVPPSGPHPSPRAAALQPCGCLRCFQTLSIRTEYTRYLRAYYPRGCCHSSPWR
ncbi:hypothetical protein CGRA01v4_07714 [Colletotrichum graminicola]|nr:hypothetical protein CGRA01v4_07714 [Colletotrichum graminicola]